MNSPTLEWSDTRSRALTVFDELRSYLEAQIIGQEKLVESLLVSLLGDGHLLVEGPPGLAKTRAIKALAQGLECDFQRVQFTPDMLPADLTGSDIYRPDEGLFHFQPGPLFHHLILADEINRAPAKVQSALLEAMAERQISVGSATYPLPELFLVMATQNPIEHEGTYPLPEAQLDRFMLHTLVDYPDRATTLRIMELARREALEGRELLPPARALALDAVFAARRETLHGADHRRGQADQAGRHQLQVAGGDADVVRQFLALGQEGVHVPPGAEVLAFAADQHAAHAAIAVHAHHGLVQGLEQFDVQAIG